MGQDRGDPYDATLQSGDTVAEPAARGGSGRGSPRTIERYQVEREIGRGAMGVVYAALDPDLERRVAIKVLQGADDVDARARLLREARAMALLSHPNVMTVFQVGTSGGDDYIAMELIEGSSLAMWLRTTRRARAEILDAFLDAGRGLAAAHGAGLVHRDFKPHNVLRSSDGRVVVTDFGLARVHISAEADTKPASRDSGSLTSTLTNTGAVLGTPAYMAPEQHDGAVVGPAADQFSFCVALWEALAGVRPFDADTMPDIRDRITRGPEQPDIARIPRRMRSILRRGLAVEPGARWPSMDALLAALRRARRLRWRLVAGGGVVVAGAAIALAASGHDAAPSEACDPTAELAAFRAAPARARLSTVPGAGDNLAALDQAASVWTETHRRACKDRSDPYRERRMACLGSIRAELGIALEVLVALDPVRIREFDGIDLVGDPKACEASPVPARVTPDERAIPVYRMYFDSNAPAAAWPPEPGADAPCLRAMWWLARAFFDPNGQPDPRDPEAAAVESADRCGDDRINAMVAVVVAQRETAPSIRRALLRRADAAIARAGGDRLWHAYHRYEQGVDRYTRGDDTQGALADMMAAAELAASIGAREAARTYRVWTAEVLRLSGRPEDLANAERLYRMALDTTSWDIAAEARRRLIEVVWKQGRVDEAHRLAAELAPPPAPRKAMRVRGRVLDGSGRPVVGAHVVSAPVLWGDARSISVTASRSGSTDAEGRFELDGVGVDDVVAAELGSLRSAPATVGSDVELRLVSTGAVVGRVVGALDRFPDVRAHAPYDSQSPEGRASVNALLGTDGSFRIEGLRRGPVEVSVAWGSNWRLREKKRRVTIGAVPTGPIELAMPVITGGELVVLVRSEVQTALSTARVSVLSGRQQPKRNQDLYQLTQVAQDESAAPLGSGERPELAAVVRDVLEPGDVVTRIDGLEPGEVTVCAFAIDDRDDPAYLRRLAKHVDTLEIGCVPVTITTERQVVVVIVPPMKRLPEE